MRFLNGKTQRNCIGPCPPGSPPPGLRSIYFVFIKGFASKNLKIKYIVFFLLRNRTQLLRWLDAHPAGGGATGPLAGVGPHLRPEHHEPGVCPVAGPSRQTDGTVPI